MAIQILSNLNYPIGNIVKQEMQSANNVQIAVAFLKDAGTVSHKIAIEKAKKEYKQFQVKTVSPAEEGSYTIQPYLIIRTIVFLSF